MCYSYWDLFEKHCGFCSNILDSFRAGFFLNFCGDPYESDIHFLVKPSKHGFMTYKILVKLSR